MRANKWSYAIRFNGISRVVLEGLEKCFHEVEWYDPGERKVHSGQNEGLSSTEKERSIDGLMVVVPFDMDCDGDRMLSFVDSNGIRREHMTILLSVRLWGDSVYDAIPATVLHLLRKLECKLLVEILKD